MLVFELRFGHTMLMFELRFYRDMNHNSFDYVD